MMSLEKVLLVVFEELQLFSDKEWRAVDSELKDLIRKDINYIIDGDPRVRLEVLNITDTNHTIDIQLSVSIIPTNEKVELTLNLERE